jgi:Collagen triple helix repeat (20 copies)
MFSALHKRIHVSPTTIIATLALVLAMTGGAYAANHFLITSTKQISPKVLKALKGANGKNGAAGPAGPAGAGTAGPAGPQGPAGAAGAKGETGTAGTPGKDGKEGKEGKPWTASGTLPSGKTETGAWTFGKIAAASISTFANVPVASFTIPLAAGMGAGHVHYINPAGKEVVFGEELEELTSTQCLGTTGAPTAEPGNFCVYAAQESGAISFNGLIENPAVVGSEETVGTTGAMVLFEVTSSPVSVQGTWAVTAP